jgi:hypothetical protein
VINPAPKPKRKSKAQKEREEFARVYHSEERRQFVASLPCVICFRVPCEGHHIKSEGVSRKAGYRFIVSVCSKHHREYHDIGRETFARKYNYIDLNRMAEITEEKWQLNESRQIA